MSKCGGVRMYAEIVTASVIIGCIPCSLHCWIYRGHWQTLGFFLGGFIFGVLRENIVALLPGMYTYPNHPLYLGAAPLVMWFGWSASFYASWCLAEFILQAFVPSKENSMLLVSLITAVIAGCLSIAVEIPAGASMTQWWIWPPEAIVVFFEMPTIVPFGWAGAAFLFVLAFMFIMKRIEEPRKAALIFLILTLVVIVIHLLYTLAVRTIIVLLIG
jgi:hypothetical protein